MTQEDEFKNQVKKKQQIIDTRMSELLERKTKTLVYIMNTKESSWLGGECVSVPYQFRADLPMPTMATDGKKVMIDPEFWLSTGPRERVFGITHELLHKMFMHTNANRVGKRDRQLWNIACDAWVNSTLVVANIGKPIAGGIPSTMGGSVELNINDKEIVIHQAHTKTPEAIFDELLKHIKQYPPKPGQKHSVLDKNGNTLDPSEMELQDMSEEEVQDAKNSLARRFAEHKSKGNLPSNIAEMIEGLLEVKINWRVELREFITPEIKSTQTFKRPNRRRHAGDLILPSMKKEGLNVTFAIDTSGSISQSEIKYYLSEIKSLFRSFGEGRVKAKIMMHTTQVYDTFGVSKLQDLEQLNVHSGGTSHIDVFAKAEDEDTKVLICLTDGYSDFPDYSKIRKVLWIVTGDGEKLIPDNLGKKISIKREDLRED